MLSSRRPWVLHHGDALEAYSEWPVPATIISDGAYGVRGFHGDTVDEGDLPEWYEPHIKAWSTAAGPATTLWFWNTEVGWATIHPLLVAHGWEYIQLITWDKGIAHVAGNVNGKTIRTYPLVTEVCAFYQRKPVGTHGEPMKQWLREEWRRAGFPLNLANPVCGVKNAATRKYLTQDYLWYHPPGEHFAALAAYANENGPKTDWPYFSLDGVTVPTAEEWDRMRYQWTHVHGITNVWARGPLHDNERLKGSMRRSAPRTYKPTGGSATHLNQKPLEFMERHVVSCTQPGDVVWEPFGGLASGAVAAVALGRRAFVAELDEHFAAIAAERLALAESEADPEAEEAGQS